MPDEILIRNIVRARIMASSAEAVAAELGLARHTATSLAAGARVHPGTIAKAAMALAARGYVPLPTPAALSSVPTPGDAR